MLYAIHAYEQTYGGFHGMEEYLVIEANNIKEVNEIATEESINIMESFNIMEKEGWLTEANEEADSEGIEDENEREEFIDSYINDLFKDNIAYEIYELKSTNKSLEELNELFYNDPNEFIKNFVKNA